MTKEDIIFMFSELSNKGISIEVIPKDEKFKVLIKSPDKITIERILNQFTEYFDYKYKHTTIGDLTKIKIKPIR